MVLIKYHYTFHTSSNFVGWIWYVMSGLFGACIATLYVLAVPCMESYGSYPITILAKNLLLRLMRINQLERFNLLWKSFSVNCCLSWIWYGCHLVSFWVIGLNDDAINPAIYLCTHVQFTSCFYGAVVEHYWYFYFG